MPIWKYKTFKVAEQALWCEKPDRAYFKRLAELWAFSDRVYPTRCRRGVFKYHSIDEANAADKLSTLNENKSI